MIFPAPVRLGDTIGIVGCSSPFDRALALRGMGWLGERYRLSFSRDMFARLGYLAGDDARRLGELQQALDSDVRAIIAARGGYGLSRIVAELDWRQFERKPKWVVGFSDVTLLHLEASRRNIASMHAPMVCALGRGCAHTRETFGSFLGAPNRARTMSGLVPVRSGRAAGPLFGGNLAMLHGAAAAGRLRVPQGSLLILEDVSERPYRIDRMLSDLLVGGHLRPAVGVLLGDFEFCDPGPDGTTAATVLAERLSKLEVPIARGLPVGHGSRNEPVVLGSWGALDADLGTLSLGERLTPAFPPRREPRFG